MHSGVAHWISTIALLQKPIHWAVAQWISNIVLPQKPIHWTIAQWIGKNSELTKPIHWAVAQWIARRLVHQTFDTGSLAHRCCMYKHTASYILSRKYKNEIHREIHHLVNSHTIDSASNASKTMWPQRQDDAHHSPLQKKSKNKGDFQTQHPEFKVDILHYMLIVHQKQQ
jgi:hypothetical protein